LNLEALGCYKIIYSGVPSLTYIPPGTQPKRRSWGPLNIDKPECSSAELNCAVYSRHPAGSPDQVVIQNFKRYALRNRLLNCGGLAHLGLSPRTIECFLGQESTKDKRVELVRHLFKEGALSKPATSSTRSGFQRKLSGNADECYAPKDARTCLLCR
jgi:hypothetical protein